MEHGVSAVQREAKFCDNDITTVVCVECASIYFPAGRGGVTGCGGLGGLVSVEYRLEGREAQGFHGDRTAAAHTFGSSCKNMGVMLPSPDGPVLIVCLLSRHEAFHRQPEGQNISALNKVRNCHRCPRY